MNWLRFITIQVVLFSTAVCFAAEPASQGEKEKIAVLRQTAQNWLDVGIAQSKRGLYGQAEKSFLAAQEYQEYLTAAEQKQLEQSLAEARLVTAEKQPISEHQRWKLTGIYYRSVQLYNAGELEKAREGFVTVAKYGPLVAPKGQTAEDYLVKIDSTLTEKYKDQPDMNAPLSANVEYAGQPAPSGTKAPFLKRFAYFIIGKKLVETPPPETRASPLKPVPAKAPVKKKADEEPKVNQTHEQTTELVVAAEPPAKTETSSAGAQKVIPENSIETTPDGDSRVKIVRAYTRAVIEDATVKVEYYISRDELDKAMSVVRAATLTIKENRSLIGDELFAQYSVRLKQLADKIAKVHKM